MNSISPGDDNRSPLSSEPYDLLVIGGGIVGTGAARDAAMRGLRVLLVEQHDFAFGTSGRSSRLLHGGLRYLAQGRLGLVYEASREKQIVHRIAPHLAEPLPFLFPSFRGGGWPRWQLRIGVTVYDRLCGRRNLGPSSALSARETLVRLPQLRRDGLRGAVRYFDGLTNDARLVIDTLRSARRYDATIRNYMRFEGADRQNGLWQCKLESQLDRQTIEIRARVVVNATGPWSAGIPHSGTRLRLTKGVHLVLDRSRLPVPDAVVMAEGSRILFAIPLGERTILGTTDTDYDGPVDAPRCDADDLRYVLDVTNTTFPDLNLTAKDVISTWAGLRPLVYDGRQGPSDISRRHEIQMPEPGWFDVTGGKLTTYRLIAEQTIDRVVRHGGFSSAQPCRTAEEPLLTGPDPAPISQVIPPPVEAEVVRHACRDEWAVRLEDVMIRRTSWRYYYVDHLAIARRAVGWMAETLGWSFDRQEEELRRYQQQTDSGAENMKLDNQKSNHEGE